MDEPPVPQIALIGVPTEAGTHFPGQLLAPARLIERDDGLNLPLASLGYKVLSFPNILSDLPATTAAWKPSPKINGARNEENALQVMRQIRKWIVEDHHLDDHDLFPVFIGGDCSITPAILSGFHHIYPENTRIGLIYMDGDVDLTLPSSHANSSDQDGSTCILDSMVLTHLTRREGGLASMREFSNRSGSPLITPDNIVLFGFDPLQPSTEHWTYLLEHRFRAFTRPSVRKDPIATATAALAFLEETCDVIFLHFDVDVIDSGEFPLGNYPHYAGLRVEEAMTAAQVFLRCKKVKGCVVTEINPNNDPEGRMVRKLVEGLKEGFRERA